jgi:hypothetical protein
VQPKLEVSVPDAVSKSLAIAIAESIAVAQPVTEPFAQSLPITQLITLTKPIAVPQSFAITVTIAIPFVRSAICGWLLQRGSWDRVDHASQRLHLRRADPSFNLGATSGELRAEPCNSERSRRPQLAGIATENL